MKRLMAPIALFAGGLTWRTRANVARVLSVCAKMWLACLVLEHVDEARHAEQRLRTPNALSDLISSKITLHYIIKYVNVLYKKINAVINFKNLF